MYNIYLMYIHYFCSLSWYFLHPRAQLRMPRSWQRTHVPPNQTAGTSEPPRSPPLSSSGRRTMQNSLHLSYRNPTSNLQDIQFSWLLRITKVCPAFKAACQHKSGDIRLFLHPRPRLVWRQRIAGDMPYLSTSGVYNDYSKANNIQQPLMEQFATVIYGLLMVTSVQQDHPLDHEDSTSGHTRRGSTGSAGSTRCVLRTRPPNLRTRRSLWLPMALAHQWWFIWIPEFLKSYKLD